MRDIHSDARKQAHWRPGWGGEVEVKAHHPPVNGQAFPFWRPRPLLLNFPKSRRHAAISGNQLARVHMLEYVDHPSWAYIPRLGGSRGREGQGGEGQNASEIHLARNETADNTAQRIRASKATSMSKMCRRYSPPPTSAVKQITPRVGAITIRPIASSRVMKYLPA
ncbi:hypothetical protein BDV93DRAFT_596224 [Ceratobasidium sp. AG-I]|nr:hypothetical protein BDV93DRAFT_596224 [Ceratobasidium sp. AG-I]